MTKVAACKQRVNSKVKEIVCFISIGGRLPFEIIPLNNKAYCVMPNFPTKIQPFFENNI